MPFTGPSLATLQLQHGLQQQLAARVHQQHQQLAARAQAMRRGAIDDGEMEGAEDVTNAAVWQSAREWGFFWLLCAHFFGKRRLTGVFRVFVNL